MIGPSSSHTAGAARLGMVAKKISKSEIRKVSFLLHGSFAKTYRGHGTDKALIAGILGMDPSDENLKYSMEIANEKNLEYEFIETDLGDVHSNTVKIVMIDRDGRKSELIGSSIGGGNIKVIEINGLTVEFAGEYPTLIVRHIDQPSVIANVTNILGNLGINIAFMKVFRQIKGKDAFMIIETDNEISLEVIDKLRFIGKEIIEVYTIDPL
jgi:L-serine dehydratase